MNLDEIKKYAEFEIFTRDKSSNIEIPIDLLDFAKDVGLKSIIFDWSVENIALYGMNDIYEMQNVYSNEINLYAIGDIIYNPIFINENEKYKVNIAKHGVGEIKLEPFAINIQEMVKILGVYVKIFYEDFNKNILDENYEVSPNFKKALELKLKNVTDENCIVTFMEYL